MPVKNAGRVRAVLDLDSPHLDAFSCEEADLLRALVDEIFDRPDVVW